MSIEPIEPTSHRPHLDVTTTWWSDPPPPPDAPPFTFAPWPAPRRPRIGLSIALLLGSLLLSPLAPACWWLARAELRGMDGGTVADEDRGWFRFVRAWGAILTCLAITLLVLLVFGLAMPRET